MGELLIGVAAMLAKDVLKQQYLKSRDYERNVRQAYRDVDNLKIALDHIKKSCQIQTLSWGQAEFIHKAEQQHYDAIHTLGKHYPGKPSLSKLIGYASTPGAEMHLLDIGKEANQTKRGLGDVLSEIRFAKLGHTMHDEMKDGVNLPVAAPRKIPSDELQLGDGIIFAGTSPARRRPGRQTRHTSPVATRASSIHSARISGKLRRRRRHCSSFCNDEQDHQRELLVASNWPSLGSPDNLAKARQDRGQALDKLQSGIEWVLGTADKRQGCKAMDYIESAVQEVLRLQKSHGGFLGGPQTDQDLGNAVEDLDEVMRDLLVAKSEKAMEHAVRDLSHVLEVVDAALCMRAQRREQEVETKKAGQSRQSHAPTGALTGTVRGRCVAGDGWMGGWRRNLQKSRNAGAV